MIDPTLEQRLNRYLDGELSADEADAFERELEHSAALQSALADAQANDALLRSAMAESIPDEITTGDLDRFGLGAGAPSADIIPFARPSANDNRPVWRRWAVPAGGALAAALALVLLIPRQTPDPWATPQFSAALDSTVSLQQASVEDATLVPRLTFRAADGRYCREFALRGAKEAWNRDGIACRSGKGRWQPELLVPGRGNIGGPATIELAGGEGNAALDAAYDRLGGTAPLGAAAEQALIGGRWRDAED